MTFNDLKLITTMSRILLLRTAAIAIQLCAVIILYFSASVDIAIEPLLTVIGIETVFHGLSCWWYRSRHHGDIGVSLQIIADIVFLTLLMSFSGGATNAFVSLLLLPIVIGAVSLPAHLLILVSTFAVVSYSALLLSLPIHNHHMNMSNHFIGMWANFLLSVVVVTLVVGTMAKMITNRERAIAKHREEQLKSEQLVALGVASAQVTHQLATPLANLQLLFEEINEDYPNDAAVCAMEAPLETCRKELNHFRELATSIREDNIIYISPDMLLDNTKNAINLQYPQVNIVIENTITPSSSQWIKSDAMLIPALCNLIQNAVNANVVTQSNTVEITLTIKDCFVFISIRDFGEGIEQTLVNLGGELIQSKEGLGMALMLSSSSIERLGGELLLKNHTNKGAIAIVKLPLIIEKQVT